MSKEFAIDPDKVAIYIRWSTEDQGEGTTLEVQLEGCRHYVHSQGWHLHADLTLIDNGYSGGSMDRPALKKLRKLVQQGKVQCVVCYKLDRLSRSVVDTVNLVLEEWDDLCHIKSAREPIDTTSHAGKMFFYTLVSYAEWERNTIRERTASGRVRRAQEGRWAAGKPPYGYTKDMEKRLVPDVDEASVVARIFRDYMSGKGTVTIAYELQREGIPFRGKSWRVGAVLRVLANRVYLGELVFGATRANPKYKKRPDEPRNKVAEEPYVRIEGGAPSLVSQEDFNVVQAMKRERDPVKTRKGGRAYSSPYLLSALATCAKCGHGLIGYKQLNASAGKAPAYYCRGHKDKGSAFCDCGFVRTPHLDGFVVSALKERFGGALAKEHFLDGMLRDAALKLEQIRLGREALSKSLAKLDGEATHIRKLLRAAEITTQEYRSLVADIEAESGGLREQLQEALSQEDALLAQQGTQARMRYLLDHVESFEELELEQQKHLLRQFISSLKVYKPKGRHELQVDIAWRFAEAGRPVEYNEQTVT